MPSKNLSKTKLSVLVFSLSVLFLTAAFFLSGLTWKQIVNAIVPSFPHKGPGSNLTSGDWNGLLGDFVKKSGDTMSGPLTVPQINASRIVTHQMCMGGHCHNNWPKNNFGGMYAANGGHCYYRNPMTGRCGCPPGYVPRAVFYDTGHHADYKSLYLCYKP